MSRKSNNLQDKDITQINNEIVLEFPCINLKIHSALYLFIVIKEEIHKDKEKMITMS